jgi:hypothetical protein
MTPPAIAGRWRAHIAAAIIIAFFSTGCVDTAPDGRVTQIQRLEDELSAERRLRAQREQLLSEQAEVIQKLQGIDSAQRMQLLVYVDRIEIERLSGGYDDDNDGLDEGVVVYLRLYDADGDVIKAAGSATVRLIDLTRPDAPQTVGGRQWTPAELRPLWYGKLMTNHFTLRVPWTGHAKIAPARQITIVAQFTDLQTGKTFSAQKDVEITGLSATTRPAC